MAHPTIEWKDGKVVMIDQRYLPERETYNEYCSYHEVAEAIRSLIVRGAPAIGCTAAFGVVLAALKYGGGDPEEIRGHVRNAMNLLSGTRPTAVNLFWAIERMAACLSFIGDGSGPQVTRALETEAVAIFEEDLTACHLIGDIGSELVPKGSKILTHCNAGALATAGHGTALGVIRSAVEAGKEIKVLADEIDPSFRAPASPPGSSPGTAST